MSTSTVQVRFTRDGASRTVRDWNGSGRSAWTNVRRWAKKHGAAGAWRADGSFVMFFRDGGKVRRKTWRRAVPAR